MKKHMPDSVKNMSITRSTTLKIASIEKDRYGGIYSLDGEFSTKELKIENNYVKITADINPGGFIEITSPDLSDLNNIIYKSVTDYKINNLNNLKKKEISLHFKISNATIYTISI